MLGPQRFPYVPKGEIGAGIMVPRTQFVSAGFFGEGTVRQLATAVKSALEKVRTDSRVPLRPIACGEANSRDVLTARRARRFPPHRTRP